MKFTTVALTVFAAAVSASPFVPANATSSVVPVNTTSTVPVVSSHPTSPLDPLVNVGPVVPEPVLPNIPGILFCDNIVACVEELADVVSTCAAAAAAGAMDIVQDVKCLVDAAESITKIPKACKGCL